MCNGQQSTCWMPPGQPIAGRRPGRVTPHHCNLVISWKTSGGCVMIRNKQSRTLSRWSIAAERNRVDSPLRLPGAPSSQLSAEGSHPIAPRRRIIVRRV